MIEEEYFYDDELDEEEVEYYAIRPNKTQIKRDIAAIFSMAEEISSLAPAQLAQFELPEKIETALLDAGKMGKNAARKRLLKFITAQLRELDIDAVKEKLARMKNQSAHAVREHHQAERWRDQLVADTGNQLLTSFIAEYPDADIQHVRQLQRNAQKEAKEGKPPKSARLLYRYIKDLISDQQEQPLSFEGDAETE